MGQSGLEDCQTAPRCLRYGTVASSAKIGRERLSSDRLKTGKIRKDDWSKLEDAASILSKQEIYFSDENTDIDDVKPDRIVVI